MPTKLSLVSSWRITNAQNYIFTTKYLKSDTLVSAILILPVTLAPLTGLHAAKRRDILRVSIPSAFEFSYLVFLIVDLF